MPALVGIKRLREEYEDDLAELQDAILQALARYTTVDATVEGTVEALGSDGNRLPLTDQNMPFGLKLTLQHLIAEAGKAQEPLMTYKLSSSSQPAVQTLLKTAVGIAKAAIGSAKVPAVGAGEVFQLIEDIVETNNTEDVKACFTFMASYWAELHDTHAMAVLLRFQRACNMFTRKVSNDQDAEILGAVSTEVAKMLPFNSKAGLNMLFMVNKHATPMDKDIGASVDGSAPVDLALYQQLWDLQAAFQDPHDQGEPNKWAKTVASIHDVLRKLKEEPIGVASRTTAVPQDGGKSVIVKYLTSSKLTRLQLRDAAFRRTLLVQCLVLLHACAHPKHAVNKAPLRQLREKQISEHAQLQQQLYEELSRTPEQGAVFTDMVKTVLERETAFVKWKSEGAAAYWEKTGPGPAVAASLDIKLPKVPASKTKPTEINGNEPDTSLHLSRMLDNSGADADLYRKNRDIQMLPTTEQHLAHVGTELTQGDFRRNRQYANAGATTGVDPLFLFRAQRMLQRKSIDIWERTTQMNSPGERLEIAFADLYPERLPPNWTRPKVEMKSPTQNGAKKAAGKLAVSRAASDANEGDKQAVDQIITETAVAADGLESGAEEDSIKGQAEADTAAEAPIDATGVDRQGELTSAGAAAGQTTPAANKAADPGTAEPDRVQQPKVVPASEQLTSDTADAGAADPVTAGTPVPQEPNVEPVSQSSIVQSAATDKTAAEGQTDLQRTAAEAASDALTADAQAELTSVEAVFMDEDNS